MPLYPSLQDGLALRNCSLRPLEQTIQLQPSNSLIIPLSKLKSFHVVNTETEGDSHDHVHVLLDKCLQNLTSLDSLTISSSHWLDSDGKQLEALSKLSSLAFENIPGLLSLPSWLQNLTQLKDLTIRNCDGLTSLFPVFQHLTSLRSLDICGCKELELSAPDNDNDTQIFQDYTSLIALDLEYIPKCTHLPEWLQNLSNLRRLYLHDLPNLTSLPGQMQRLTNLKYLYVNKIPQLSERCRKDIGADWPKIAHIPLIDIS